MKKYTKYKPSGVEWIGEIPEHWNIRRFRFSADLLFSNVDKHSFPEEKEVCLCNYTDVYKNEFITSKISFMKATATIFEIEKFEIQKEDIIITKDSESADDIAVPAIVREDLFNILCGYHLAIIRGYENYLCNEYLYRLFSSKVFNGYFESEAKGFTRFSISSLVFKDAMLTIPKLPEQTSIARFLDHKTALIDRITSNRGKQIALLKEERKAVINKAVTKGINKNAKMKQSGIEWLGEIPEHWDVVKLKYLVAKIGSGVTPKGGAEVYQEFGIPLLRSQNVHFDGLRLDDVAYISEQIHNSMSSSKVFPNDVLLNITGASIGRCFFVESTLGEANVNQHVCIIRPNIKIIPKFLYLILASPIGQQQIDMSQNGASREALNFEQLSNFFIPSIAIPEQKAIILHIEEKTSKIDTLITKYEKQISLIEEYRTALISKAVTGQIDVREWQPKTELEFMP